MKNVEKTGELNTIIGKGSFFEGKINVDHSLRVDGQMQGDIDSNDMLVIGKEGDVTGNIKVKTLILGGKLKGTVLAENKIVLEASASLIGEIKTSKLVIDEGAIFDGRCSMKDVDTAELKKEKFF
jgi:cytoskeletal protein CcmA (bactofilin family)